MTSSQQPHYPQMPTLSRPPQPVNQVSVMQVIEEATKHPVAQIRKLAEKADDAVNNLRKGLREESQRDEVRARLAKLNEERDALLEKLKPKPSKSSKRKPKPVLPGEHGSWASYKAHSDSGELPCDVCNTPGNIKTAKRLASMGQFSGYQGESLDGE